jgi:hypothetical protein
VIRYRTADAYATGQPGHAGAGLTMAAYHAMLWRVIAGLARLGVRYVVRWSDDAAEVANEAFKSGGCVLATTFNNLGVGAIIAGIVAPTVNGSLAGAGHVVAWVVIGAELIAAAQLLLGRLRTP